MKSTLIRVIPLKTGGSDELVKLMHTIFKASNHGLHHNKILDLLNTKNVHLMLVDIDSLTEKRLKTMKYKPEAQPRLVPCIQD